MPRLRLPLRRVRRGPGALLSLLIHATAIGALLAASGEWLARRAGGPGPRREERGGGRGEARAINFFTLPAAHPAAVDVAPPPQLAPSGLAALARISVTLPPLELPPNPPPVALASRAGAPGAGAGGGDGRGTGSGTGSGADVGPGTAGEGGYIFGAEPRETLLPPMAQAPGSVVGRTYHVQFWVAADGRVTRVDVDPPILDAKYSRAFREKMMEYQFYPAHTRDGRRVASVVVVTLRIGN